jgi:hypothetical protein
MPLALMALARSRVGAAIELKKPDRDRTNLASAIAAGSFDASKGV